MMAYSLRGLDLTRWESWALVLMSLGLVMLAFVGTRLVFWGRPASRPAPLPAEPLSADPFLYGSPGEKRSAARRKGGVVQILISDETAQAEPWGGYVVDRSLGGICVGAKRRAQPGTLLTLRTVDAPAGTPWLEVKVRSCREGTDGWMLGCQFVRIPPTGLLFLFG